MTTYRSLNVIHQQLKNCQLEFILRFTSKIQQLHLTYQYNSKSRHTLPDTIIVGYNNHNIKLYRSINSKRGNFWIVPLLHSVSDTSTKEAILNSNPDKLSSSKNSEHNGFKILDRMLT